MASLLLLSLLCTSAQSAAPYPNVIATQSAHGQDAFASWFADLPLYHIPTGVAPSIPSQDPARDLVYGSPLTFSVFPLSPASTYSLTLSFLDDAVSYSRAMSLTASGVSIAPRIALPPQQKFNATYIISGSAVSALPGGQLGLTLSLAALAGPNAILGAFSLASSNPAEAPIAPPRQPSPSHLLPRLTPRPAAVAGAGEQLLLDLNGQWGFDPLGGTNFTASLTVPGEYTLQGYRVPRGQPVAYSRTFAVPLAWGGGGLRTKLRFDGASSNASVYLNGVYVGGHLGGFTPFELDVTSALAPGGASNTLTVQLVGYSLADELASASQYAAHDLGGLSRKVYLMVVPQLCLADVHAVTAFTDSTRTAADLLLNITLANDSSAPTSGAGPVLVNVTLAYGGQQEVAAQLALPAMPLAAGAVAYLAASLRVAAPPLWDAEHPRLHNLTLTLLGEGGAAAQSVALRIGFRDVAVVGNRVVLNGRPIKARGTTRHEVHPLVGRALYTLEPAGGQWERDILAFRDANVNYIRTSHYPPPEELMAAADELGMLIELEMPFCWASGNTGSLDFNYTVQAQREAMVHNRNHPSVIHWSLGNVSERKERLTLRSLLSSPPST